MDANEQKQAQESLAAEQASEQQAPNQRTLREAYDELEREFNVRERCFPKWITEGRISRSDAKDRLERHAAAMFFLSKLLDGSKPF